jgi:hypothetical protein
VVAKTQRAAIGVPEHATVPRFFQFAVLVFILATGAVPQLLQAWFNGLSSSDASFAVALILRLIHDLLRVAPLIILSRHPAGILHPLIVAVVVWPLLMSLPNLIDSFGGYAGLLSGLPLSAPHFVALGWLEPDEMWIEVAKYSGLQIISLLALYAGFVYAGAPAGARTKAFRNIDTLRLRAILIGIVIANTLAVALFIQVRGGLVEHVMQLAFGRFRALEGLGPLLAIFDIGFLAMLLWICVRPQDARSPLFLILLPVVVVQQFIVAGSRGATLIVLVLVGLGWALAARRLPWRLGLILLPVAFLSFGALNVIRTAGTSNTTALEAAQGADLESILARSQEEFDLRQSLSGAVPVVSDSARTTGAMWGYTYIGAAAAMIPRAIWPDKPRGPGSLYAQYFLGEAVEGTAIPIGPVAEAYWNFGVPGTIVIFVLYGFVLKRAYGVYMRNPGNGLVIAGFVLVATQFGVSTDELVAFQQMTLTSAVLLGIVYLFYPAAFRPVDASRLVAKPLRTG